MLECLEKTLGIVTPAAEKCGISRSSHYDWLRNDPNYRDAVESLNEVVLDFAEQNMIKRINEGSDQLIKFLLQTRGKERGYVKRQEHDHSGNMSIEWKEERVYEVKSKTDAGS